MNSYCLAESTLEQVGLVFGVLHDVWGISISSNPDWRIILYFFRLYPSHCRYSILVSYPIFLNNFRATSVFPDKNSNPERLERLSFNILLHIYSSLFFQFFLILPSSQLLPNSICIRALKNFFSVFRGTDPLTLWSPLGHICPTRIDLWTDRCSVCCWTARLACTQQTHCGMHASIFSHTQMTTRAGSLVYVRVESGRDRAHKEICGPTDHFQQFWNGYGR